MTDFGGHTKLNQRDLLPRSNARRGVVHALIPRHVGLIRNHEAPQPLDAVVGSKAGDEQPRWKTLFLPQRLAILQVGHHAVIHGFRQRDAVRSTCFRPLPRQPPNWLLSSRDFFEQYRQRHTAPFVAAHDAVRVLDCHGSRVLSFAGMAPRARISQALEERNLGDGRQRFRSSMLNASGTFH